MLTFEYRNSDRRAVLLWDETDTFLPWLSILKDMIQSASQEARGEGAFSISLPWWSFLRLRHDLESLISGFALRSGVNFQIADSALSLLAIARQQEENYHHATQAQRLDEAMLQARLREVGFGRQLTHEQIRNVRLLGAISAGATFSVPGAGKTTEAFATFVYRALPEDRLLVIAPKNAFAAWDEQLEICMPSLRERFVRLRKTDKIPGQLRDDPRFMIIGYQQLARVREYIAEHLASHRTHVFIDESHRIKGMLNVSTDAVLSFAHLPVSKLILSGTPMPQSFADLLPQFHFLYPEIPADETNVVQLIRPVYVRTNKAELGLPPVDRQLKQLPMDPLQAHLYRLMKSEVARDAEQALSQRSKDGFRRLGRSVTRILQFVSNPGLLAREIGFAHSNELAAAIAEGRGPKLRYVMRRARELARDNKKVLIWSSFVDNVEYLAASLQDLGAVYIHGGVDAGDENDEDTREGKIRLFHDDPSVMVMVANPAAASEGISLHTVCHHSIYLDRNFNAAQYLQSEDRIHRLGLPMNQQTTIEIVECEATVDVAVRTRLEFKINQMAIALRDSGLNISAVRIDVDEEDAEASLLDDDDIRALLQILGN